MFITPCFVTVFYFILCIQIIKAVFAQELLNTKEMRYIKVCVL